MQGITTSHPSTVDIRAHIVLYRKSQGRKFSRLSPKQDVSTIKTFPFSAVTNLRKDKVLGDEEIAAQQEAFLL